MNISKYFILFLFLYNRWFPIGNWAWVWPKLLVIHTYPTYATSMGWLWGPLLFCSSERGKEPRRFCVPQIGRGGPTLCEIDAKMPSPLAHQARAHRVPAGLSGKSPANVLVAQKSVGPAFHAWIQFKAHAHSHQPRTEHYLLKKSVLLNFDNLE